MSRRGGRGRRGRGNAGALRPDSKPANVRETAGRGGRGNAGAPRTDAKPANVREIAGRSGSAGAPRERIPAAISLRERILKLLGSPRYQPQDKVELTHELGLTSDDRAQLRTLLRDMEQEGVIARIRKDRYVLPREANLFTGILRLTRNGRARLDCGEGPQIFISPENAGVAMHGDRVVARQIHEGREQRDDRRSAQVIRILERANETIVGTLQASKRFYFVVPDDARLVHNIYVEHGEGSVGDKVVVKLEEWLSPETNPEGRIIEVLGPASAPGVDMLSIIRRNNLPTEFTGAVLEARRIASRRKWMSMTPRGARICGMS